MGPNIKQISLHLSTHHRNKKARKDSIKEKRCRNTWKGCLFSKDIFTVGTNSFDVAGSMDRSVQETNYNCHQILCQLFTFQNFKNLYIKVTTRPSCSLFPFLFNHNARGIYRPHRNDNFSVKNAKKTD